MNDGDPEQFRRRSRTELLFEFVRARFLSIVAIASIGFGIALVVGIDPEVPRWTKLIGFTAVAFVPIGYVLGNWLVGLLYNPQYQYLIDLDATETDGALYQFPYDEFKELSVNDGELDTLTSRLHAGKNVDLENGSVDGCWRGTLSDRELLTALSKIEECRGTLEDDAKRGFRIETQAWTIIRNATRKATLSVVETFERGTLPDDGQGIGSEIESALSDFDLDRKIRHADYADESTPDAETVDEKGDLENPDQNEPQPQPADDD